MNKFFSLAVIATMIAVFSLTSCGPRIGGQVQGETIKTEGWVDDDTYRIAAGAVAKQTLTNKVARRESCKRAAILNAQYQILEKFKGAKTEGAAGMSDFEMTGMAVAQEVQGVVKGGSVQKVTFDAEDNCEIIYEVKAKGLKKKVMAAEIK